MARRTTTLPPYRAQLATLVDAAPEGDAWLHELKYDGYRLGCAISGSDVHLESRRGGDWTAHFPEIVRAARELRTKSALIDGEVAALLPDGRTSFQALQNAFGAGPRPALAYFAFDLLHLDGKDTTGLPLEERKQLLERLIAQLSSKSEIRYSEHVVGDGPRVFQRACELGAEGIVSKRSGQRYRAGRNTDWQKTKCQKRQEFAVGGFTDPEGSRHGVGSLLIGHYQADLLVFAGKVGTGKGFGHAFWSSLRAQLERLEIDRCPFSPRPSGWLGKHAHWLRPALVVEVQFSEWTAGGHVRHPSLLGFRNDKAASEVVRERPRPRRSGEHIEIQGVRISSPERVLYPALDITKRELVQFYAEIAEWILPHLRGRPLTLVRCEAGASRPNALRSECNFLRHTPGWNRWAPEYVRHVQISEQRKLGDYLIIDDERSLLAVINGDILELHAWNSTAERLEHPDRLVFDLDPGERVPWAQVTAAARALRQRLERVGLESWVKTTGGKGLHVVVPLRPDATWDACFAFSTRIAEAMAREQPAQYITAFGKSTRQGKILIDYKRNHRGAVAVSAYSSRARPDASLSVPLSWRELGNEPGPSRHTVHNLTQRLKRLKRDPWHDYWKCTQSLPSDAT